MVFITASPLLARNVSKLYHRVLNYLKGMLKEKESKVLHSNNIGNHQSIFGFEFAIKYSKQQEGSSTTSLSSKRR